MYYYVYDACALTKSSQRILTNIETQINNLGLSGERGQVSALRKVEDLVSEAARKKYRPIVAVGDDATFNAALNALAAQKSQIPLGYIPLGTKQPMAELLGVDRGNAVVSLSRRIIRWVPLAAAGKAYFLSFVHCVLPEEPDKKKTFFEKIFKSRAPVFTATLTVDKVLKATVAATGLVVHFDPAHERLRIEMHGAQTQSPRGNKNDRDLSVVWAKQIRLESQPQLACLIDGRPVTRTPIGISVSSTRVPLIVGRSRAFA